MINLLFALLLAQPTTPTLTTTSDVVEKIESVSGIDISELTDEEIQQLVNELNNKANEYLSVIENETITTLVKSVLNFLTTIAGLVIFLRKFSTKVDTGNFTLKEAKTVLEEGRKESKVLCDGIKEISDKYDSNANQVTELMKAMSLGLNTINKSIISLTNRIEELEAAQEDEPNEEENQIVQE